MTIKHVIRNNSYYAKDLDSGKAYGLDPVTGELKEYASELECWKAIDEFNRRIH